MQWAETPPVTTALAWVFIAQPFGIVYIITMPPQMPACGTSKLRATSGHPRPSVSQPQCVRPLRPVAALATPRAAGSPSAARLTQAIPSLSRFADSLKSHGISSTADLESIHFDLHLADAQRTTQFLKVGEGPKGLWVLCAFTTGTQMQTAD